MGIFEKFKLGFKKSADNIASGLREIIIKKEIDDETLNKIEEFLISSDVGIDAAAEIKEIISQNKIDPKKNPVDEINDILKNYILELMEPLERKDFFHKKEKLNKPLLFHDFHYQILSVDIIQSPPQSNLCTYKIQSPPNHILCVPKTQ